MAETTKIEWTDHTFNPWIGCSKVSAACKICYAETDTPARVARSRGMELWGPRGGRQIKAEAGWKEPLRWDAAIAASGGRARVFCASSADVFEGADTMPAKDFLAVEAARDRL